jgi:hypothetical protein
MTGISDGSQGNRVGTPQASINPLQGALGSYGGPTPTMALLPGSPAIGGGKSGANVPKTDHRGQPRSGPVDVGAFESQGFTLTPVAGSTPQSAAVGAAFKKPLEVAVTANNPVEPADGGVISFAAPSVGASATVSAATAVIADGHAGVTATANETPGRYIATASAAGARSGRFVLTNTKALRLAAPTTPGLIGHSSPARPPAGISPAATREGDDRSGGEPLLPPLGDDGGPAGIMALLPSFWSASKKRPPGGLSLRPAQLPRSILVVPALPEDQRSGRAVRGSALWAMGPASVSRLGPMPFTQKQTGGQDVPADEPRSVLSWHTGPLCSREISPGG